MRSCRNGPLDARLSELLPLLAPEWVARAGKRYDVILHDHAPAYTIDIIKNIRRVTGQGPNEVKDIMFTLPRTICERVDRAKAEVTVKELQVHSLRPEWPFHATITLRVSAPAT